MRTDIRVGKHIRIALYMFSHVGRNKAFMSLGACENLINSLQKSELFKHFHVLLEKFCFAFSHSSSSVCKLKNTIFNLLTAVPIVFLFSISRKYGEKYSNCWNANKEFNFTSTKHSVRVKRWWKNGLQVKSFSKFARHELSLPSKYSIWTSF